MAPRLRHLIGQGFALLALVLAMLALAGIVTTDSYSRAAGAEARGVDALMRQVAGQPGGPSMDQFVAVQR